MNIRRTPVTAAAIAAPMLLALAACGDDAEVTVEDDGREATGEVLEGTISDAMLPLDEVRSQAPLAAQEETPSGAGGTSSAPASEPAPVATPEPAAEPIAPDPATDGE